MDTAFRRSATRNKGLASLSRAVGTKKCESIIRAEGETIGVMQ